MSVPVSSCLVLSCLLLSCLVLRDSGRMFRVSLLRCLVCLARSLFVLSVVCVVLCFVCEFVCVRVCFRRRTPQNQQENILEAAAPATPSVCLCLCSVVWFGLFGFAWACAGLCVLGGGEGVYASNASPCVRSKRFRVYRHQAHMFHTCGLGAGTHGNVLNVHTEAF